MGWGLGCGGGGWDVVVGVGMWWLRLGCGGGVQVGMWMCVPGK